MYISLHNVAEFLLLISMSNNPFQYRQIEFLSNTGGYVNEQFPPTNFQCLNPRYKQNNCWDWCFSEVSEHTNYQIIY